MAKRAAEPEPNGRGDRRQRPVRSMENVECEKRMARDYAAADKIIKTSAALDEVIRAQRRLGEIDPKMIDALFDGVILPESKVTMTVQQFFVALAARYATNEQLARFLYGRASEATLNRLHAVFHSLRKISDGDWARMDMRGRPAGTTTMTS